MDSVTVAYTDVGQSRLLTTRDEICFIPMGAYSLSSTVRHPAVAGLFYPAEADALRALIEQLLADVSVDVDLPSSPKALIVPHAGYPYSGSVAAAAYRLLERFRQSISRVVVIGPSHRIYLSGIAMPKAESFVTPLGELPIDAKARYLLARRGDVMASDAPHELEHCLEVQLPFLQTVLNDFTLVPLVVGSTTAEHVASVLRDVWGDSETLIVASSDLSHYLTYEVAREFDEQTATAIRSGRATLSHSQACGAYALNGLLRVANDLGLNVSEICRLNSGDTAGDMRRVVGYGAFALHESQRHAS